MTFNNTLTGYTVALSCSHSI